MKLPLTVIFLLFGLFTVNAKIIMPHIFSDNMILQRNQLVPVWGNANAGNHITVVFGSQKSETVAGADGNWKVNLQPMEASSNPLEMQIFGDDTVTFKNVLVGEVWLCSGQSNMEYMVNRNFKKYTLPERGPDKGAEALKNPVNPHLRLFLAEKKQNVPDVVTKYAWQECNDSSIQTISAVGYFFACEILKNLNVPVGIISSSWGGSRIEPWTPEEAYIAAPWFTPDTTKTFQIDGSKVGNMWSSMIKPIVPFAIRGFLWYQGESNCMINDGLRYADKFELMLNAWRKAWDNPNLPFYFVQIAPYYYTKRNDKKPHTSETLAEFWEAQYKTLQLPNTGMVVTTDLVDKLSDIHPSYKWEVGRRLSLIALSNTYSKSVPETSGPVFLNYKIKGQKVVVSFTHTGKGLKSADGKELTWFTICGADSVYKPATAKIVNNKIVVTSNEVPKPKQVRFAWDETAMPNLVNSEGLPAVPFRSNTPEWKPKLKP